MTQIAAHLKYYHCSPRKVRLLTDVLKGKMAHEAVLELSGTAKRSAPVLLKLLKSAMANARHNFKVAEPEKLYVSTFIVNEGPMLKRQLSRARGSTSPIRKRMSHITVVLGENKQGTQKIPAVKVRGKKMASK